MRRHVTRVLLPITLITVPCCILAWSCSGYTASLVRLCRLSSVAGVIP